MSFPRYTEYKDSGVEWLGNVPAHWGVVRVKHVLASMGSGGTPDTDNEHFWADHGGTPWVAIGDMSDRDFVDATAKRLSALGVESKRLSVWPAGTLLFSMYASLGHVAELRVPAATNQAILALVPQSDTSQAFLKRWFQFVRPSLREHASSNTQDNLNAEKVRNLLLARPPLPEQRAIAAFLDRETAKIDELVAEQERLIELLDERMKACALSAFDRPETSFVRMRNVASVVSRPVAQAGKTLYTRLGLYNRGRGIFHKDPSEGDDLGESDFFWVEEGDLILSGQFSWEGSIAIAGPGEHGCVVSHRYPVIRGNDGVVRTEYLFALLRTEHGNFLLNEYSRGAAGRNRPLNIDLLMREKIPLPHMDLQDEIARLFIRREAIRHDVARKSTLLQERRSALISAAVTGQIDVRGLAPEVAA